MNISKHSILVPVNSYYTSRMQMFWSKGRYTGFTAEIRTETFAENVFSGKEKTKLTSVFMITNTVHGQSGKKVSCADSTKITILTRSFWSSPIKSEYICHVLNASRLKQKKVYACHNAYYGNFISTLTRNSVKKMLYSLRTYVCVGEHARELSGKLLHFPLGEMHRKFIERELTIICILAKVFKLHFLGTSLFFCFPLFRFLLFFYIFLTSEWLTIVRFRPLKCFQQK